MKQSFYNKILQERATVEKTSYWAEIWKEIKRIQEYARDRCVENTSDTRFFQGRASAFKDVMVLPEEIIKKIKDNLPK